MFIWNSTVYPVLFLAALPQRAALVFISKVPTYFQVQNPPGGGSLQSQILKPYAISQAQLKCHIFAKIPPLNHVPPFPLSSPLIVFYFPNFIYISLFVSLSPPQKGEQLKGKDFI